VFRPRAKTAGWPEKQGRGIDAHPGREDDRCFLRLLAEEGALDLQTGMLQLPLVG
jgi:hypothetical protein